MVTATASVTPSLTPSQQAAREFWRQSGADGMPPFYVMSQYYAELSANSDDVPTVTQKIEQLLTGLGYDTDIDTVLDELNAGLGEELGYWAGRYCLFDGDGNRFDLVVGRAQATLTVPAALVDVTKLPAGTNMASVTVLSGAAFSEGMLQLANAQFQASLRFILPVSDADFDDTSRPAAEMFQSTAPQCTGTFGLVGGGAAGAHVNGKRGAWTRAGVNQAADGDPASAWYGQYVLLEVTDVTAVKQDPDAVYIYNDPQYGLTFQWGTGDAAVYGTSVTYNNNVLQCVNEYDNTKQYAIQFVSPQPGAAEISLAVSTAGAVRSFKGYWVDHYNPAPGPALHARLAKRPMTATFNPRTLGASGDGAGAAGISGGGYSQAIDLNSLTPGNKPNRIVLPYGAVGNNYALSLNLINCAATDTFSWKKADDPTGRAAIAGTNQTVLFSLANLSKDDLGKQLLVTVQLTNNSGTTAVTYTLQLDVVVIQCDAISLAPPVLMPVVVGTAYSQNLVAHGANGNFTWSVTSTLPPGLSWDDGSRQLSGTVTDAAQVGKAFSVVVGLTAPDVIVDPLTASLGITVQPAPAVASGMPLWEEILLKGGEGALGLVVAALVFYAGYRIKTRKSKGKAEDAAKAGDTNVKNATKDDPLGVGKTIVQNQRAQDPIVQRNVPYDQNVISTIAEAQTRFSKQLAENEQLFQVMTDYYNRHQDGDPEDPIERDSPAYEELTNAGYKTLGDVVLDLPRVSRENTALRTHLKSITNSLNDLVASTEQDQRNINEHSDGAVNEEELLGTPG
jgi:hypothetical protein